ncbi:MAG TPA: hypothetical protein VK969_06505, partial [Acidimicrobiia bacterium]|nr:hypothetical protein [Acidimicrobiia bacterium]
MITKSLTTGAQMANPYMLGALCVRLGGGAAISWMHRTGTSSRRSRSCFNLSDDQDRSKCDGGAKG